MILRSALLRRLHKWIGLLIGVQFLLWALSGTAMALLSMEAVEGGPRAAQPATVLAPGSAAGWPEVRRALAGEKVAALSLRPLPWGPALEVTTAGGAVRLFDAASGAPVRIGVAEARAIAAAAHPAGAPIARAVSLDRLPLAVREHSLPIWQVDFRDSAHSSYYVSATDGALLERRTDAWRWWDFFWMLHNMDYAERTSFNHPLVVTVGIAMAWLAVTGVWLLFRTMWRHDIAAVRRRFDRAGR